MSLEKYRKKRRFAQTTEPRGKKGRKGQQQFVVQRHAASHLHYDFRLALDGVLKSWAVPKGPSLDPGQKRLAVEVEDHPLDYKDFEGTIPAGNYGAGAVMVWDRGRWLPDKDPHEGLKKGKLEFHLEGEKLRGGWVLVRSAGGSRRKNNWLLIKRRDADARPGSDREVLFDAPRSAKTGRSMEEIAAGDGDERGGKSVRKTPQDPPSAARAGGRHAKAKGVAAIPGARQAAMPSVFHPQLATLVEKPPPGEHWWHETKYDGNRIAIRVDDGKIELLSRRMQSWTSRLPHVVKAARAIHADSALLDGELVALRKDGTTSFQDLQNAFKENRAGELLYFAFDLLYLDGYDLTGAALADRKKALAKLLASPKSGGIAIHFAKHIVGRGPQCFEKACKLGFEGIISKRRDAPYLAGRGTNWLKIKCLKREEFVIGGYTDPEGARKNFGALLLGYYAGGKLVYAGRVGTGFSDRTLGELAKQLRRLKRPTAPFAASATVPGRARSLHWVDPSLVAEVEFNDWTRDGMLRQPSFQGLREDKKPHEVVREKAMSTPAAVAKSTPARRSAEVETVTAKRLGKTRPAAVDRSEFDAFGVRFTHLDKVLYSDKGITKLDLAKYYAAVAEWIIPHVAGRPLTLVRCPDGAGGGCFFQKKPGKGNPEQLRVVPIESSGERTDCLVADDLPGVLAIVQMGVLEIHLWGSRADDVERPDRLVFDLDPDPTVAWQRVVQSAHQVREFLEDLGLASFVKTTGGKGLHLVVPIARRYEWPEVSACCRRVAEAVVEGDPKRYTLKASKAARRGKIFFDYLRNGRGATSIAPYSTRARPGAPVSTPVKWEELNARLRPDEFNIENLLERLAGLSNDPWHDFQHVRQSIGTAMKKLGLR